MNNSTYLHDEETIPVFPMYVYAIFGTIGTVIILFTVAGNTLTILSYIKDTKLHSVYNTYILNLAIADFVLGSAVLPIYLAYEIGPSSLWLNYYFCKVFLVVDFTVCVEGVFMIIIISYDRLMLLRHGVTYYHHETKRKCNILIMASWSLSFLIYGPSIMFWDIWYQVDINIPGICDVQFAHHSFFTTLTAILEFFIPLVLLAVVNICIIKELRQRTKFRIVSFFSRSFRKSLKGEQTTTTNQSSISSSAAANPDTNSELIKKKTSTSKQKENKKCQTEYRKRRERKAIKSLGILMVVFLITWAPYTIYTIIKSVREGDIEIVSYEALTWFLWLKSAVNPFLYAFNSKRYRRNFQYFLCCIKAITRSPSIKL